MAKTNITEYSATPSSNTDINNINIDENCPASGLNNAIRELMAHLKNVDTGSQALTSPSFTAMSTDTISEKTSANGVAIDGVTLKDGGVGTTASPVALHATSLNGGQFGGRRNMVINGAMQVAQRGTSLTSAGDGVYLLDRFRTYKSGGGEINVEQATDSPDDYQYSLKVTVGTADSSIASTDYYLINHRIEGYNTSQLNFGSSSAKTVTLSFWVKSSLTGTFSGSISNSDENRSYPYSYAISSANTWEYKTVTVTGDTTGTWATDNTTGIKVWWSLGNGSNYLGTANAWTSTTSQYGVTGETQLIATASATFQITGIQLEVGEQATPFEHRSYGEELALCQRYYYNHVNNSTGAIVANGDFWSASQTTGTINFPVTMRTAPSMITENGGTNYYSVYSASVEHTVSNAWTLFLPQVNCANIYVTPNSNGTSGNATRIRTNNASAFISFDSEL